MKCNLSAPQLLLLHLEKDLETLTRAVKKNEVESSALVHSVLQHIFISRCSQGMNIVIGTLYIFRHVSG